MAIANAIDLENLINDLNNFYGKTGASFTDNVTLSDGFEMESYRKFVINELTRTGNTWVSDKLYLEDDMLTYNNKLYVAIANNINMQPDLNVLKWSEIKKEGSSSGFGLNGFVSFEVTEGTIISSENVDSVTKISETEYQIIVSDLIRKGAGNRLIWAFSYESLDIDESLIRYNSPYKYFIKGKCSVNSDNTLRINLNTDSTLEFSPIINLVFM